MSKAANEVVSAFSRHEAKSGATIWTDGHTLYSYQMPIARHDGDGILIVNKGPTVTTSKHINIAKRTLPVNALIHVHNLPTRVCKCK